MLTTRTGSPVRTSRSAERALTILLVLAEARQPLSFAELQRSLGWPQGSLHALLKTLESQRFVLLDVDKGKYTVGIAALEVGARAQRLLARTGRCLEQGYVALASRIRIASILLPWRRTRPWSSNSPSSSLIRTWKSSHLPKVTMR